MLIRSLAVVVLVVACGAEPVAVTTTVPSTTAAATTTTTMTAARSQWCLERDAGAWTEPPTPQPYDPAPLEAEKAEILRRLERATAQSLREADAAYDNMAETWADDPATLAEVEDARRQTRA